MASSGKKRRDDHISITVNEDHLKAHSTHTAQTDVVNLLN